MSFFDSFKKKSKEELSIEITELKAKRDGIALTPKDEYKALLKERNDLKWGKARAKFKSVLNAIGKVSEAHNEHGLDMGESNKKESLKSASKGSKAKTASDQNDSFVMDYGFSNMRDPGKPLKGESKTVGQGSFWEGTTK